MLGPFGKLLCAAALAGAAFAQNVSISIVTGSVVTAGWTVLLQVERYVPQYDAVAEIGFVIASCPCAAGCADPNLGLGTILYSGPYDPQPASAEFAFQIFPVTIPAWYNGPAQLVVARFYAQGIYAIPKLELATTNFTVVGGSG